MSASEFLNSEGKRLKTICCWNNYSPFHAPGVDQGFLGNLFTSDKKYTSQAIFENHFVVWAFDSLYDVAAGAVTPVTGCTGAVTKECATTFFAATHPTDFCKINDKNAMLETLTCDKAGAVNSAPPAELEAWKAALPVSIFLIVTSILSLSNNSFDKSSITSLNILRDWMMTWQLVWVLVFHVFFCW